MSSRRGELTLVLGLVAAAIVACKDPLGGSTGGVEITSISDLTVPYPTVVAGDVMRDSAGVATPVSIKAFDSQGVVILSATPQITILDGTTTALASSIHIDQFGFVHGVFRDTVGARVYAGFGTLVAPVQRILVSDAPATAVKVVPPTPAAITFDTNAPDTTAQSNWSPPLQLTLSDGNALGAPGFIIKYQVTRSPTPSTAGAVTAYVGDDGARTSPRDTTDKNGLVGRRVILRLTAVGDAALIAGTKTDTIIVRATLMYGATIPGMPFDFIIPVKRKP